VRGLDCANEVSALRKTVGILPGVKELDFDILKGKMILSLDTGLTGEKEIFGAVKKAGLEASHWVDKCTCSACVTGEKPWIKQGVFLACLLGGFFLFAGFLSHGIIHKSFLHALVAGEAGIKHSYPLAAIIFYVFSMVSSAWYITPKALVSVKNLRMDMNFLMLLSVAGAVIIGEWFEGTVVIFLFSLARLLESWSVGRARRAIGALMEITPTKARYICPHHGDIEEKPIEEVPAGVTVIVKPGEKIPLDGIITKGSTSINQSPITGESLPVSKKIGDEVYGGTINEEGSFEFRVTKTAENTTLSRIIRMVEDAQSRRAPTEQWIEKFARYYTPLMILLALVFFLFLLFFSGLTWSESLYRALVILVISCPCALVISTPVSIVAGLASAARSGILIKGGVYLEIPASLKAIALDKTGTLTYGRPVVQEVLPYHGHSAQDIIKRAASLEYHSEHPLGRAILDKAKKDEIKFVPAEDFSSFKGKGARGYIDGNFCWIGSFRFAKEMGEVSPEISSLAKKLQEEGNTVVFLGKEKKVCAIITLRDGIRENVISVLEELKNLGIEKIFMLTGDNYGTAKSVASALGLEDFKGELLPEDKVSFIENLVSKFKQVAMVGDGVNDAPAMAASSAGIAMGAMGTDAAIETSHIVLMTDDLSRLPWLIRHSKKTLFIIKENIIFATATKFLFMILAFLGMATLWMAIAADMGASLLVIFNGLRLLNRKI